MIKESKQYQLTCLLSPLIDQKKIEEIGQKIKNWITEKEGLLAEPEKSLTALRKKLAYPIKKYQEAFCLNLSFLLGERSISQLNQQLNLEKDILRYFIVTKPKPKAKPIKEKIDYKMANKIDQLVAKEVPLSEKSTPERIFSPEKIRPAQEETKSSGKKAKIEELDKKLEEILNQ